MATTTEVGGAVPGRVEWRDGECPLVAWIRAERFPRVVLEAAAHEGADLDEVWVRPVRSGDDAPEWATHVALYVDED